MRGRESRLASAGRIIAIDNDDLPAGLGEQVRGRETGDARTCDLRVPCHRSPLR